jgi:hypothetical protein
MTHDLSPLQLHILRELAQYEGELTLHELLDCSLLPFAAVDRSLDLEGRRAAAVAAEQELKRAIPRAVRGLQERALVQETRIAGRKGATFPGAKLTTAGEALMAEIGTATH